jgi:hypothetical protein
LSLPRRQTPQQALRVVAALVTVLLVLLLGTLSTDERERLAYHHYVALGDSYTAAPFVPLTDTADGCYRSSNNYPHRIAAALHIDDLQDRSCSGAQTRDLTVSQRTGRGFRVPPQFEALSRKTDLVTVGIGANNGHLYARLTTVCRLSNKICRLHDRRAILGSIVDQVEPALSETLEQVKERAPRARVLLVGYPKLLPARGNCSKLPRMRPQDRATFRNINLRLRQQMRAAAQKADVEFVDFYAVSYGHNICARHPWIQGKIGNGRQGAAMHPLPIGQAVLARTIEKILRTEPPGTSDN